MENRHKLWLRWVGANALGEMFGLGATLGIGILVQSVLGEPQTVWMSLFIFMLMVAGGAIEGTIVGLFQWWAMHPWLMRIARRTWVGATVAGALIAWFFGALPFSLMDMSAQASGGQVVEPPQILVLLGAAVVGLVAGAVLALFQWLALRRYVNKAGWWLPANMLAWAAGMPLIFAGIDLIQKGFSPIAVGIALGFVLLLTGAVVGAIHGAFFVRFTPRQLSLRPH